MAPQEIRSEPQVKSSKKKKKQKNVNQVNTIESKNTNNNDKKNVNAPIVEPIVEKPKSPRVVRKKNNLPIAISERAFDDEDNNDEGWNTVPLSKNSKLKQENKKRAAKKKVNTTSIKINEKKSAVKPVIQKDPEEILRVPQNLHGMLVGPKFITMNRIQELTNTRVTVPSRDSNSNELTITGKPEAIKACKRVINDMVILIYVYAHIISHYLYDFLYKKVKMLLFLAPF